MSVFQNLEKKVQRVGDCAVTFSLTTNMFCILHMIVSVSCVTSLPWLGRRLTTTRARLGTRCFAVEIYCPDSSCPHPVSLRGTEDVAMKEYPPLIYHINSDRAFPSLRSLIKHETNLPVSYINELCEFGAVYLSTVQAVKSVDEQRKVVNPKSTARSSSSSSHQKQIKVERIHSLDMPVEKGTYCRVHGNPRRSLGMLSLPYPIDVTI